MIIHDFLNKRHSTRELSDEEFNRLAPIMAQELSSDVDYVTSYTDAELLTDRRKLVEWKPKGTFASTNRIGMKLCEHFFPNFYDIETPAGKSFASQWRDPVIMEKVLHWNRKSHSTPYLSELKRGVYFCGGLPKSTMYRPQMSKMVVSAYCKTGQFVLDPCAGWGGRLLGTIVNQCHYIGFEPNTETFNNLQRMVDFLGIQKFVTLINDDALNMGKYDFPSCKVVLTSPPYFNLEVYTTKEETQSVHGRSTYEEWEEGFLKPLIINCSDRLLSGGASCWNVAKVGKYDMWKSVEYAHNEIGYIEDRVFDVVSSSRQVHQKVNKYSTNSTLSYIKK